MITKPAPSEAFDQLRPRLLALLEMHRTAASDEARTRLAETFEDIFLAAAWHVAQDLLENGWRPRATMASPPPLGLRVVGGSEMIAGPSRASG